MANEIDALIVNHSASDRYDYRDYNRVGAAVAYVAGILNGERGFNISVTAKHDWVEGDIQRQSDINRYLADVQKCRAAFAQLQSTPEAPAVMEYEVDTANRIERILLAVDDALNRMAKSWFYSGEIGCGEV